MALNTRIDKLQIRSNSVDVTPSRFACYVCGVLGFSVMFIACGQRVGPGSTARSREAAQTVPAIPVAVGIPETTYLGLASVPLIDTSPTQVPVPLVTSIETTTVAPNQRFSLRSDLGEVSGEIPISAGPDPLTATYPAPPAFVGAVTRWVIGNSRVTLVLQSVRPLYPDDEMISSFVSSGLTWNMYDVGPRDGSQVAIIATSGGISISIGAQTLFADKQTDMSIRDLVVGIAKSVAVAA